MAVHPAPQLVQPVADTALCRADRPRPIPAFASGGLIGLLGGLIGLGGAEFRLARLIGPFSKP